MLLSNTALIAAFAWCFDLLCERRFLDDVLDGVVEWAACSEQCESL